MPFYAVAIGRRRGIYQTWPECKNQVNKFEGARYKKFNSREEAQSFIDTHSSASSKTQKRKFSGQGSAIEEGNVVVKAARIEVNSSTVVVYTDGACSSNGQKGAKAGIGVFWDDNHADNIAEPLLNGPQTNNRAEYQAVIRALEIAKIRKHASLQIRTDSNLLVQSMNEWMPKWKRNGWKTSMKQDVKNRDLLEKIDRLRNQVNVDFVHIRGHAGIYGNEKADELARHGVVLNTSV